MLQKISLAALWVSTGLLLVVMAVQGISGNWAVFYLVWPGSNVGGTFLDFVAQLANYHVSAGYVIGGFSILVIIFAFLSRASIYVRAFAIVGFALTASAAYGGYSFVNSAFQDRLSLGQMADSFVGAFAAFFLQLFFMGRKTKFPWSRLKGG